MPNELNLRFLDIIVNFFGQEYLMANLFYRVAPVIFSDKPSVLISLPNSRYIDPQNLYFLWDKYRGGFLRNLHIFLDKDDYLCTPTHIRTVDFNFFELRKTKYSILLLFYNSHRLYDAVFEEENFKFLVSCGFPRRMEQEEYLSILRQRLISSFPHEIGLFLGIPLIDVRGFILNKGEGYLLNGYWKVYHQPKRARAAFNSFDQAKKSALDILELRDRHLISFFHR